MRAQPAGVGGGSGHLGAGGGGVLEPPNALGVALALGVVEGGLTVLWGAEARARLSGEARTRGRARRLGGGGLRARAPPHAPHPCRPTTAPSLATRRGCP